MIGDNIRALRKAKGMTLDELAAAVGKTSSLAAVALTDINFCSLVEKHIGE
jgi:transcriptional regulator with XRE-family HTH domain